MARFQPSSLMEVLIGRESGRLKRIADIRRTANGKKPGETRGLRHLPFDWNPGMIEMVVRDSQFRVLGKSRYRKDSLQNCRGQKFREKEKYVALRTLPYKYIRYPNKRANESNNARNSINKELQTQGYQNL